MLYLLLLSALYNYRAPLINKIDPRCYENEIVHAWVYFTDKGITAEEINRVLEGIKRRMNYSSINRRILRKSQVYYEDIPVKEDYIEEVIARGGILLYRSKWLNAASFLLNRADLEEIAKLDFVYKITPVARSKNIREIEKSVQQDTGLLTDRQLRMFNIDSLHKLGVFGSNVRVGFLDTGLRRKHIALDSVKVIAEHDFLSGDQIFMEGNPVTYQYGVYTSLLFKSTSNRIELFAVGDTYYLHQPTRDVLYTYSMDNGATWREMKNLTNNFNTWVTELAVCGDSPTFVFYRDRSGIKFLTMDTSLITQPQNLTSGLSFREPSAVEIGDTVYLFYQNKNRLYLRKGTSNGFNPEELIDSSGSNIKMPRAIGGDFKVGIFYYNYPGDSIFFLRDTIPVSSFSKKFTNLIGKDPSALSSGDTIFLVYKDASTPPLLRIGFTKSTDFGQTFKSPLILSGELNSIGKVSIARIQNQILIAWENEGCIYFRLSFDNGNNFGNLDSLNKEFVYLPTLGVVAQEFKKFYCERGDDNTDDTTYHPRHGTEMLGLVGGYSPDNYIGVAPGAQFIVAKTENPDSVYEFPIEEDTWVCGLEWCEEKGADIVSSSLGYTNWYHWPEDYDGRTSPASIAAYEATKRGVIVVTAAGNVAMPQLVIPGDAQGVITVGGIDTLFARWEYSGYGPTYDGRIKPELVCLGAAPIVVNPDSTNSFLYSFGTSGATALVSGICALLLEGHPNWNPDSIREALIKTASKADSPTDSIGYGWPDAVKAFYYTSPIGGYPLKKNCLLTPFPNPFIIGVHKNICLPFFLNTKTYVEFYIFSISGKLIKKEERTAQLAPGKYTDTDPASLNAGFLWDGKDMDGNFVGSGIYYCLLHTLSGGDDITKVVVIK
uniref:Peptidase S8/S53 domain-containing protein n=1 Tax=candidate division WOR-3 bacterium TaxID=2052148 RepID=A0A7C4XLL3_UNCW3